MRTVERIDAFISRAIDKLKPVTVENVLEELHKKGLEVNEGKRDFSTFSPDFVVSSEEGIGETWVVIQKSVNSRDIVGFSQNRDQDKKLIIITTEKNLPSGYEWFGAQQGVLVQNANKVSEVVKIISQEVAA